MRILMLATLAASGLYAQTAPLQPAPKLPDLLNLNPKKWNVRPFQQAGTPKTVPGQVLIQQQATTCAIPLLNVGSVESFNGDPKMALPSFSSSSDSSISIQAMPVCGKPDEVTPGKTVVIK